MKKVLIQCLYIFVLVIIFYFYLTWANACEQEVKPDLLVCEELQVSTEEKPCKKREGNINTVIKALEKLAESGTLPK